MRGILFSVAAVMAVLVMAACGDDGAPALVSPKHSPSPTISPGEDRLLDLSLRTDKGSYRAGEPVALTLTVANNGGYALTLSFTSGQRYDFLVRNESGSEVWRWSADKVFAEALGEEKLEAGANLTYEEIWDQKDALGQQVAAGHYNLTGFVATCRFTQADLTVVESDCSGFSSPAATIEIVP